MPNIADLFVSIGADLTDFKKGTAQVSRELNKTKKDVNNFGNAFDGIKGQIAAALSVGAAIALGKEIINTTAEFQKFEAVLSNSLGSNSKAQIALQAIQKFAAETPFSVRELTEAYVQLANRGITPSTKTLTALGDVAAALGKPLQQVNEAILDVTNSERWTELGIKVKVNGDKITGTFRGMTVEAEKSEAGALKLIETFGQMQGVAGGMAKVAETLGGKISNLGDSWDQFTLSLGNSTDGVLAWTITALQEMVKLSTDLVKGQELLAKEKHLQNLGKAAEGVLPRFQELVELNKQLGQDDKTAQLNAYKQLEEELKGIVSLQQERLGQIVQETKSITDRSRLDALAKEYEDTKKIIELNEKKLESLGKLNPNNPAKQAEEELGALERLRKELKDVTAEREKAGSGDIAGFNIRITAIQSEIERLESLGQATGLIGKEVAELKKLEAARDAAKTEEQVLYYNDLITAAEEYINMLDNVSAKEFALSKMEIKPLQAKGMVEVQFGPSYLTEAGEVLRDLQKEFDVATAKSQAFGDSFDLAGTKAELLTAAITTLIEQGVSPSSPIIERLKEQLLELSQTAQSVTIDIGSLVTSSLTSFAESLGAMAGGAQSLDSFLDGILLAIIDFAQNFGKLLISAGIASEAFQKSLASNPYIAIAAGAALVAATAAAKAFLNRGPQMSGGGGSPTPMANGGLVYGTSYIMAGEYPGASNNPEVIAPLSKLKEYIGDGGGNVNVSGEFTVKGTDLKLVLEKQNKKDNRVY